jgi:hypothetical protein
VDAEGDEVEVIAQATVVGGAVGEGAVVRMLVALAERGKWADFRRQ